MHVLLEGQIFDNTYRLVRLVGEGGMGAVYEATHARLAGRYAIKVLLEKLSENPEALTRFDREARITSLLQHPNVVQVIDHNTAADGTEYLVMEYLAGESLGDRLFRERTLSLEAVVGIVEQIAAGLAAAHAHGVVHRDLKPDNVFLIPVEGRDAESVKILDFGISKVKDPRLGLQVTDGPLFGTPQYMSPEQVQGHPAEVDASTDQFALAAITYEMLTGHNPFEADTVAGVLARVMNGEPPPTEIHRDVDRVIRRGLAKSKRDRFPSVTDFSDALHRAVVGPQHEIKKSQAAAIAYAPGAVANLNGRRKSRRRNWGLALMSAVVGCSMAFVVGGTRPRRPSAFPALSAAPGTTNRPPSGPVAERHAAPPSRLITLADKLPTLFSQPVGPASPSPDQGIEAVREAPRAVVAPVIVPITPRASHRSGSPRARSDRRSSHVRDTTKRLRQAQDEFRAVPSAVTSRARPAATSSSFPLDNDDDATMPLDETVSGR